MQEETGVRDLKNWSILPRKGRTGAIVAVGLRYNNSPHDDHCIDVVITGQDYKDDPVKWAVAKLWDYCFMWDAGVIQEQFHDVKVNGDEYPEISGALDVSEILYDTAIGFVQEAKYHLGEDEYRAFVG